MLKKLFIALSVMMVISMSAMDEPVCYLALMPLDVHDVIAYFLTCNNETEEELIARRKIAISKEIMQTVHTLSRTLYTNSLQLALGEYCPDGTKFAWIGSSSGIEPSKLIIFDVQKGIGSALAHHTLAQKKYVAIAPSRLAQFVALIVRKSYVIDEFYLERCADTRDYGLILKNLMTQEVRNFEIAKDFIPSSVAFNKQGTHIIVHGETIVEGSLACYPGHTIFPLKVIEPTHDMDVELKLSPLQEYFAEKGVCKCIGHLGKEK